MANENPPLAKVGEFDARMTQQIAELTDAERAKLCQRGLRHSPLDLILVIQALLKRRVEAAYAAGRAASGAQPCPVCLGRTKVPAGFYSGVGNTWASSTTEPETCRSCNGKGYLAAAPVPAQLSDLLKINVIIHDNPELEGEWIAIPHESFTALRNALLLRQPAGTKE